MYKQLLWLCSMALPAVVYCQLKADSTITKPAVSRRPEILTNGFFEVASNGQINASARFVRLYIGEPGRFALPLSLYSGVAANNFQSQPGPVGPRTNDHLLNAFINPLSGLVNVSVDGVCYLSNQSKLTRTALLYHIGERLLTGYKQAPVTSGQTGQPVNFLNSFAVAGIYFQTGAWERSSGSMGICWLSMRYIGCYTGQTQLRQFLPDVVTNGLYHGYSMGGGVEINNLLNLKLLYYRYIKQPEINYSLPIYQLSVNYSLKN